MRLSNNLESLEPRTAEEVVDQALAGAYADSACFTCSFQAEDMIVLHLLRKRIPSIPVLFLETALESMGYEIGRAHV